MRPFREKLRDEVWWLEQAAHALRGQSASLAAFLLFFSWAPPLFTAASTATAGLLLGLVIELAQNLGDDENDYLDLAADTVFHGLGGLVYSIPVLILLS